MPRYIDAEKIDFRIPYYPDEDGGDALVSLKTVKRCIDMTPTEDVTPIVRCKDCKRKNPNGWKCLRDNLWHDADDFCSYGTRKE